MDILVNLAGQSMALLADIRPGVGLVAGVLAAVLAAHGGWHLTDRVLAWRGRGGEGLQHGED